MSYLARSCFFKTKIGLKLALFEYQLNIPLGATENNHHIIVSFLGQNWPKNHMISSSGRPRLLSFIIIITMLPFCSACQAESPGPGFFLRTPQQQPSFHFKLAEIEEQLLLSAETTLLQVELRPSFSATRPSKPFLDREFPPDLCSLGSFEHMLIDRWRRLSEVAPKAGLFGSGVEVGEKAEEKGSGEGLSWLALAAALACLAERESIFRSIFSSREANAAGLYALLVRCKSEIREITVDDFVPVNEEGRPAFCPQLTSGLELLLIEKARAKACGSYQKMLEQSQDVRACLQDITWAPTSAYKTTLPPGDLWLKIEAALSAGYPCLALTAGHQHVQWNQLQLTPKHYYSVLQAKTLSHKLGSEFRVLKLRNAFKAESYKGEGSASDSLFWEQLEAGEAKSQMLSSVGSKQGLSYVLFSDFLKYFSEVFVCHWVGSPKYLCHPLRCEAKARGQVYELVVKQEGSFSFTLQQQHMTSQAGQLRDQGWSRVTMLLAANKSQQLIPSYEYLDGLLSYNNQSSSLIAPLSAGSYVLYVKVDPTAPSGNLPAKANLVAYSKQFCYIKESSQSKHPDLLKLVFGDYGRKNKRQFYSSDEMWSSWKLFSQCGYGFICFGNNASSKESFALTLDEQQLLKHNYRLKKPFKGKGRQTVRVHPGQETIVLLRIVNSHVKDINFPPPIRIEIQSSQQPKTKVTP